MCALRSYFVFVVASPAQTLKANPGSLHCTLHCPRGLLISHVCHSGTEPRGSPSWCTALRGAVPPRCVYKLVVCQVMTAVCPCAFVIILKQGGTPFVLLPCVFFSPREKGEVTPSWPFLSDSLGPWVEVLHFACRVCQETDGWVQSNAPFACLHNLFRTKCLMHHVLDTMCIWACDAFRVGWYPANRKTVGGRKVNEPFSSLSALSFRAK